MNILNNRNKRTSIFKAVALCAASPLIALRSSARPRLATMASASSSAVIFSHVRRFFFGSSGSSGCVGCFHSGI